MPIENLPSPRADGLCVDCGKQKAKTHDKRFCKRCLKKRITRAIPIQWNMRYRRRTAEMREETYVTKRGHGQR